MNVPESRYYAGTIDDYGELVSDSLPARRGERLIITIINGEIWWDLLSQASMSAQGPGGWARMEAQADGEHVLVLDRPTGKYHSLLLPDDPLYPNITCYIHGLVMGLPKWPSKVVLPESMQKCGAVG